MTEDRERAEFEKWADGRVTGQLIGLERDGAGYKAEGVQRAWEVWEAARCEERKRTLRYEQAHEKMHAYLKEIGDSVCEFCEALAGLEKED